jgi:abortive infection bacteriophage resistance protein
MKLKEPISIKNQLDLLVSRGMVIDDIDEASQFIKDRHYYRLNIYFHKLMESPDRFIDGTTFKKVIDIYENDRWLRHEIVRLLEVVEVLFRSRLAHFLSMNFGADVFYKTEAFFDREKHYELLKRFETELDRNVNDPIVIHHKRKFDNKFPIWVVVEFLSFNSLSKMYKNLKNSIKKDLTREVCDYDMRLVTSWLHSFSVLRNICAHYSYLYKRAYSIRPKIPTSCKWNENDTLFAILLVLQKIVNPIDWSGFIARLQDSEMNRRQFILGDYGFPPNWLDHFQ